MANVQQAREALGAELRELRKSAGLSGKELAGRLGWPPSKISKIEHGRQTPTEADIAAWAEAVGQPDSVERLLAHLRALEVLYNEWRRQLRAGMQVRQRAILDLESQTSTLRVFESVYIPGLLQTAEYARLRLAEGAELYGAPPDIDEAVRVRMQRQEVLYRPGKRFHIVVTEAALRYDLAPRDVMLGQLDRLVSASTLKNVRLGVIPFGTRYPVAPIHGFWLFDDDVVLVETFAAELKLTQPDEIAIYRQVFERLASVARYGADARRVLAAVMTDLER